MRDTRQLLMNDQTDIAYLEELRRWAKYGRLMSGIIHNLNTPLMGITGRVELIGFKMPDLKGLDQIAKQLQRINDILVPLAFLVDKDMNIERALTDIKDLITKVDRLCYAHMKYKHRINVELELGDGLLAEVYPTGVVNALYEVCMNAAEALPDDGNLLIGAAHITDTIVIRIENDGPPIDADILGQISEPGVTSRQGRAGLGCHIARLGIESSGGSIMWENEAPGVVCLIELPSARRSE